MCGLMSDLVICKFRKSMVIHDTKYPYWDQVSLNNTNQSDTPKVIKWTYVYPCISLWVNIHVIYVYHESLVPYSTKIQDLKLYNYFTVVCLTSCLSNMVLRDCLVISDSLDKKLYRNILTCVLQPNIMDCLCQIHAFIVIIHEGYQRGYLCYPRINGARLGSSKLLTCTHLEGSSVYWYWQMACISILILWSVKFCNGMNVKYLWGIIAVLQLMGGE